MATAFTRALEVFGGQHCSAWRNGLMLSDAIEVSGAIDINRIEVPLVGKTSQGYKPGRESREGSVRVQKKDTSWELEVYQFLSTSLEQRRAVRGTPAATIREFTLKIRLDDPDAKDFELWQLNGCKIWRLPMGFSITDDTLDREYPLTWEEEIPLRTFRIDPQTGQPIVVHSIEA